MGASQPRFLAAAMLVCAFAPLTAWAQDAPAEAAAQSKEAAAGQGAGVAAPTADSLATEARKLFADKKIDEACATFAASRKLEAKVATAFELAACYAAQGKTATAWAEFGAVASLAQREGDSERAAQALANKQELATRLPYLLLRAKDMAAGSRITLDGEPVDAAMLELPLPVDPGKHEVAATAPGKARWSQLVEVPSQKTEIFVEVPQLEDEAAPAPKPASAAAPKPAPAAPAPKAAAPPPSEDVEPSGLSPLVWIGFGMAGAGAVVGAITGALTLSKSGDITDNCVEGFCPPEQEDALSSATTLANVTNVAFVVGGVGLGLGIVGLLISESADDEAGADVVRLEPVVGPGSLGLRGRF